MGLLGFSFLFVFGSAVAVQSLSECGPGDAKKLGGAHLIVAGLLHRPEGEFTIDPREKRKLVIFAGCLKENLDGAFEWHEVDLAPVFFSQIVGIGGS